MRESGYYPPGAEFDPNAPWNEKERKPITRRRNVIMTLSKVMDIDTYDYINESPEYPDFMGGIDLSDVDWEKDFNEQYYDIPTLLRRMGELLRKWEPETMPDWQRRDYEKLLRESEGWIYEEMQTENV